MNSLDPVPAIPRWSFLTVLIMIALLTPFDSGIISAIPESPGQQRGDLMALFRILGYLPTWVGISLLLLVAQSNTDRPRLPSHTKSLLLTPMISGALSEALKPIFRRPDPVPGLVDTWQRAPFGPEWWDGTDFCFPSGHSAVAFGAAISISRHWPGTPPWIFLAAAGCAATRILEHGHYPTDVLASLLIALWVSQRLEPVIRD